MAIYWHTREDILNAVRSRIEPVRTVLDIGCGIRPQNYILPLLNICCDPFEQYVNYLRKWTETKLEGVFVVLKAGWKDIAEKLMPHSVDSIFLLDIVEHLEKEEGVRLLKLTERIARRQIIIFTPLGFLPQEHEGSRDAWGLGGGEYQQHKSGWLPDEDFDDSWEIHACKDFHRFNNLGKPFEIPYGAFWAIKNLSVSAGSIDGTRVLSDVNSILNTLGYVPFAPDEFQTLILNRCTSAVRKLDAVTAEKNRCMDEYRQLLDGYSYLGSELDKSREDYRLLVEKHERLNTEHERLKMCYNGILLSDSYRLGQRIAAKPWLFKLLKRLSKLRQHIPY